MVVRHVSIRRAVTSVALLVLLAGCGDGGTTGGTGGNAVGSPAVASTPTGSPSPEPSDPAGCNGAAPGGQLVKFGPDGAANLVGVVFGTGRTGLVFAHQSRANRCQWAAYAIESAKAGYRTMTFDFPGSGESPAGVDNDAAVIAAAAYLRAQGVQTVVLIGASMGGNAVLAAAARIDPPVAGVISLSAPALFQGIDAVAAVHGLAVPVLYAACQNDPGYPEDASKLYAATPGNHPRALLVVPGCSSHGVQLVDPTKQPEATSVRSAVDDFLAAHAPV
jgi:pimeloyl-ACP methyl ester carboxylesterase